MSNQPAPNIMELDHSPDTENINIQDTSLSFLQNDCSTELHTESPSNQEATDNDKKSDDSDQTSNKSRELKSLLALSKEANLKTNISHKRKKESPRTFSSDTEIRKSVKLASDSKHFKFPVTAEAELDELHQENDVKVHNVVKRKRDSLSENSSGGVDAEEFGKRNKKTAHMEFKVFKPNKDIFCWRCHREGVNVVCETCSRSYHQKCLKQTITDATHWPCPECVAILKAESTQTRSPAMKGMNLEHLCSLLKFAVLRMIQCQGSEPFLHPVSDREFPEYKKYIIQPMDLTMLEKNIKDNLYGSTQAFEADAKWLLHNSIIFNSYQSKLTSAAKAMIKICKQEMMEIENCPSCYLKANTNKSTWFVEVCPKPHILVWAKLKGFPYWPAKAMSISANGMVDVRFFGAHDRAWVHYKECYLYSEKDPNTFKQKRFDIEKCVEELNVYIDNLKKIYGEFRYAPFRTTLNSEDIYKQLTIFLPKYKSIKARRKSFRDSSDFKTDEQTDTKSETIPKEEVLEEPEKSETSSNGHSNVNSPVHDNDTTMEGYGTDDDMHSEIDHESRKAFAGKKVLNYDKIEDEDDEDDTQVPSNISVENSVLRGNVRTRGGFSNSTGKLKILPPMSAENLLSDDITSPTRKTSRRNSDQSVKSDSSRISSKSDKINRVNISENMEITLGNEDIGCVSISENLSPVNGESSRSESENNFEIKKKPVQVDIENAEFSISPNKVKISDQLIKKISDEKKIENVKKSLDYIDSDGESSSSVSKKQPKKTNLNGDVKKSPDEKNDENTPAIKKKIENILSEYELESKAKTIQPSITEYMIVVPKILEENLLLEYQPSNIGNDDTSEKVDSEKKIDSAPGTIPENMDVDLPPTTKQDIITSSPSKTTSENQAEIVKNKAPEESSVSEKDMHVSRLNKEVSNSDSENAITQVSDSETQVDNENVSLEKISQVSSLAKEPPTSSTSEKVVQKELATIEPVSSSSLNHNYCKKMEKSIEESLKNRNIEVVAVSESKNNLKAVSEREVSEKLGNLIGLEITLSKAKPITKQSEHSEKTEENSGKPTSPSKERSDSPKKVLNKEINDILEEFEEGEEEEIDTVNKIVYDKKKIFDVIHSSLKLRGHEMDIEKVKNVNVSNKNKEVSQQTSKKVVEITKKRKLMPDVTHSPAKIVKLVSIESILNRKDKDETEQTEKSTDKSPEKPPALVPEACIAPENIKSEPESEDEMMDETGEMEEKRKYLYALNIHEKTAESEKIERNEIRTRSKAEEKRERFKVVDNLTRIIDDVAMNYSALHEGEKIPQRKPERRKSNGVPHSHEGEIFVKSFAKIPTPPPGKQKARKTFPMPLYLKSLVSVPKRDLSLFKREQNPQKILNSTISLKPVQEKSITSSPSTSTKTVTSIAVSSVPTSTNLIHQTTVTSGAVSTQTSVGLSPSSCGVATSSSSLSVGPATSVVPSLIASPTSHTQSMAMGHVILMPGSTLSYCAPISNPSINTVLRTSTSLSTPLLSSQTQQSILKNIKKAPNLKTSQNYIPHEDTDSSESAPPTNAANHSLDEHSNLQRSQEAINTPVSPASNNIEPSSNTTNPPTTASIEQEDEFAVLNGLVPESVSLAVSELLLRAPPRLKPRPPAITSQIFDEGIPSCAGDVTTKINSIAHRMTDYFRGMLIETLEDIGKTASPEAKIAGLHLEIEAIKHRHSLEMAEMRKNMCTILKDIQRSIVEEREKIVDETRAACENETIKRVELAKSKQWCANCPKEAQFYCCWNTSYCDYPCQQKHWPQHAGKCTQSIEKVTGTGAVPPPRPPGQPIVLRPALAAPKPMGRIIGKPTKVYMNKTSTPQKSVSKTVPSGLTLVETTPGNFELVGNGSIGLGGKIYTTTSAAAIASTKYKPTSSSTGTSSRQSDQSRQASSSGNKPQYII